MSGQEAKGWLRSVVTFFLKLGITVAAFFVLLRYPVETSDGSRVVALQAIIDYLPQIEWDTFWRFALIAFFIRACGIACSMTRWALLLRGQGIVFPAWHIVTTFLIGRFLGTFLPSTIGLDGYKLYDAARYSGRTIEAAAATVLEKGLGLIGIFLCFLVTFPLGRSLFGEHALIVGLVTVPLALTVTVGFFTILLHPHVLGRALERLPAGGQGKIATWVTRMHAAAAAYRGQAGLLVVAALLSFGVHFFTAVTYFFTAIAVGAHHAAFWEVAFASTIQIFATVMSPFTIAGEGVREIVQTLLLAHRIGAEPSMLSAALGFWVAEAPTLSGGIFYLMRTASYRPQVVVRAVRPEVSSSAGPPN